MNEPRIPTAPDGDEPVDLSSAPCSMREADDVYMGYAPREEIVATLSDLLAVMEKGAAPDVHQRPDVDQGPDVDMWARDRAWAVATLRRHIAALAGTPSAPVMGADAGMARQRVTALLPRIRDDALHADLALILAGPRP